MSQYKQLKVWHVAMDLAVEAYQIAKLLPQEERYALSDQIRRAAVSVPSNIAEGAGRKSTRDYVHFLKIAYGSLNELETQLLLCCRIYHFDESIIEKAMQLSSEVGKMLNAIILRFASTYADG